MQSLYENLCCGTCLYYIAIFLSLDNNPHWRVQVILIDVLRRAGADVTVASVEDSLQVPSMVSAWLLQCQTQGPCAARPRLLVCRSTCREELNLLRTR